MLVFRARVMTHGLDRDGGVCMDIQDRRLFEVAQHQSEVQARELLQLVLDNIPQYVFWKDRNSVYIGCNALFARDAGFSGPEAIIGRTDFELGVPREEAAWFREVDRRIMETGKPEFRVVEPIHRPGGRLVWLETSKVPLRDEAGRVVGILGTYEDITQREELKNRLMLSESRLLQAQRIAAMGNWESDLVRNSLHWSDEVYRIFGIEPQSFEANNEAFFRRIHPDDVSEVMQASFHALQHGHPYDIEHRIVRPDGAIRHVHQMAEVDFDDMGNAIRMSGTVQDITERKLVEEERQDLLLRERAVLQDLETVRELARLKGSFVGAVSHELRTPLTSIRGYLEFLEDEIGGPLTETQREYLGAVSRGAARLQHLVEDLLDYTRLDAGTFRLNPQLADFAHTVRESVESLRPQALGQEVSIRLVLPSETMPFVMDSQRISQVILNYLYNAVKFTPRGGQITVSVWREVAGLRCEVHDTGPGIAEEDLPRLFQRFSQLEEGTLKGGTGLGLNISKSIVEAHGGRVGVQSRPGEGSTFWFALPEAPAL